MKNRILKRVVGFVPILLIIGLVAALIYCVFYIERLEDQIYGRDRIIQELSFRSDLVEEYFDIMQDSIEHTTSYSLKSSKANIVIKQQDSTELLFCFGEKKLSVNGLVEEFNMLLKDYHKLEKDYNKTVKDYKKTVDDFNDEFKKNMRQIQELTSVLGLIEKRYGIQYDVKIDSTFSIIELSNTERVDSALVLLPYYKDKLKKTSDSVWTIKYYEQKK